MPLAQNDCVVVTREVEVTEGVVVGGDRLRVYGTAPTWAPGSNEITSGINTGDGGVKSVRAGLRFADASIPSELIYRLNIEEMLDVLRTTEPGSEASLSSISSSWDQAGTQLSTATGPTITATTPGDYTPLIGLEGGMLETTDVGGIDPANARPRRIIAVDANQIDVDPLYTTGTVGQISEPLITEGPLTADFDMGKLIRDQGKLNTRTVNFEFEATDHSGGSFLMARGQSGSKLSMGFDGKGVWTLGVEYMGTDYDDVTSVTQGSGTVTPNPSVDFDNMTSAEDLTFFLLNGSTQIAGENITTFALDGDATAQGVDNVAGSRNRTGVTTGDLVFTGSIKLLHDNDKILVATTLGRAGTLVPMSWKIISPDGDFIWMTIQKMLLTPSGPVPGAKGSLTDGTFNWLAQLGPGITRQLTIQHFDRP